MTRERSIILSAVRDADELVALVETGALIPLRVTGSSMLPTLRGGVDTVWLRKYGERAPRVGDIALFLRDDNRFILHRVRHLGKDYAVMNGDAQTVCEKIPREALIAYTEAVTRGDKHFRTDSVPFRIYSALWYSLRPVRREIFAHIPKSGKGNVKENKRNQNR